MGMSFLEGNEAVAYGALAAGCRFFRRLPDYASHNNIEHHVKAPTSCRRYVSTG